MTKTALEIFEDYLDDYIDGRAVAVDELLARYPQHQKELARMIDALDFLPSPPGAGMAGRLIDDYEIVREIGRGGMGAVYLARQRSLDREVALKVIERSELTPGARLERFRKEGKTIAKLDHRGIVPVFSFGEKEDLFYIAMQYVRGLPLSEIVRLGKKLGRAPTIEEIGRLLGDYLAAQNYMTRPTLPAGNSWTEVACTIVAEVAHAVAYAHRRDVLHRDIKPGNVMLRYDGHPVLLDFGLSKVLGEASMTASREGMGTPAYAAPEQLFESPEAVDRRADVYALGMTLYELLSFARPYRGESAAGIVAAIARDEPVQLGKQAPELPGELCAIVMKAIAKGPLRRFQTAEEFCEAVRPFSGLKADATVAEPRRAMKRGFKKKALVGALGAAIVAAGAFAAMHFLGRGDAEDAISWQEAAAFVGQHKTVEGVVLLTKCTPQACFLNFHPDWQNSFSAVVFASDFSNFPADIEGQYKGKRIRVSGLIEEYEGRPEIVVDHPGQITILK